jgi:peptidoglycan glycosyltransferase
MNRQIRFVGLGLLVCFTVLFAQLNRLQVFERSELEENPLNTRDIVRDFGEPRGDILTIDGEIVATTVDVGGQLRRERQYPFGELFAHVTGYFSFDFGADGVERIYNDELAGQTAAQQFDSFADLFRDNDTTADLVLTLDATVQEAARAALGDRNGSVVVLDPRDGSIVALWSFPSYDPGPLSGTDLAVARAAREALLDDPTKPDLARSYRERYPPGSTFKIVTASAGLGSGIVGLANPVFPTVAEYVPPLTTVPITNFRGSICGGALPEILRVSCNTAFAEMGAEVLGPEIMVETAEDFGFNDAPPVDLPAVAESVFPTEFERDIPRLAQSSIGQNDVAATPLQMALATAAIANGGVIMEPHVMDRIVAADGDIIDEWGARSWRRALREVDAAMMRELMIGVVEAGTATSMAIPGVVVGAKTGTAQTTASDGGTADDTHAWLVAFAAPTEGPAELVVAVIVEAVPGGGEQTGGGVAAPVARAVLEAAIAARGVGG